MKLATTLKMILLKLNSNDGEYRLGLRRDLKALRNVDLSLSNDSSKHVQGSEIGKVISQAMLYAFEGHTLLNVFAARRNFYSVAIAPNVSVFLYLNPVKQLAFILNGMGMRTDEKRLAIGFFIVFPNVLKI